jgi:cytochrome o ubiquinol oxidase operon protein cyoD
MSREKREHGSMVSYVTGFLLSLLFTFVTYYLVVNRVMTGTALLATILGFGVLQMLVQVIFFLHLGRGKGPKWNVYFFASTISIVLVVVGGSLIITNNLHYSMETASAVEKVINDEGIAQVGGKKTGACEGQHANHQVIVKNGRVSPSHTDAKLCDTLSFTNQNGNSLDIVFGDDTLSAPYAGVSDYTVKNKQNQTITLSDLGTYQFHDESKASISGSFSVRQ